MVALERRWACVADVGQCGSFFCLGFHLFGMCVLDDGGCYLFFIRVSSALQYCDSKQGQGDETSISRARTV